MKQNEEGHVSIAVSINHSDSNKYVGHRKPTKSEPKWFDHVYPKLDTFFQGAEESEPIQLHQLVNDGHLTVENAVLTIRVTREVALLSINHKRVDVEDRQAYEMSNTFFIKWM